MKLDRDQISRHQYLLFTASWRPSLLLNAGGFKKRETLVKTEAEHDLMDHKGLNQKISQRAKLHDCISSSEPE